MIVNVERGGEQSRNVVIDFLDASVHLLSLGLAGLPVGHLCFSLQPLPFRVRGTSRSSIRAFCLRPCSLNGSDCSRLLAHGRHLLSLNTSGVGLRYSLLMLDLREESALSCHFWTSPCRRQKEPIQE
ncbi:hypothetical protein EDF64_101274 [Curtobacterium flaccumfaciens]|uniref:Uncharacterized protein n=1 Tax=Curtobacterium flaccumfaciens TaxID=2035 RepID=A0A4R6DPQ9_9MICO|nr:hypothetical protein [Curtobacterium flaccumfaciens]TDN46409.1 hypothetical protein EDF64_101274 [Curtobacterium flaccumfaciens]